MSSKRRRVSAKDRASALELRKRLDRGTGSEWLDMASLRQGFGGEALSPQRKWEIAEALAGVGIETYPRLEKLPKHEKVRLEAVQPVGPGHPLPDRLRSRWRQLRVKVFAPIVALIAFAAALATLGDVFSGSNDSHVRPTQAGEMSGDLNIAVAPFTSNGVPTSDGTALARDTSRVLRSKLAQLDPDLQIELRGPDKVGPIRGRSPTAQADAAAALARRIHADIVVYAHLASSPGETAVTPLFYLNREKLPTATELVGGYRYGGPIAVPFAIGVSPQARARVRRALIRRTDSYAAAFIGVGYYITHDLRKAATYLNRALRTSPSGPSASLLELFLGNIANQNGRRRLATRHYATASRDEATHARGEFGLAEVAYQGSRGRCEPGHVDAAGLYAARGKFSRVLPVRGRVVTESEDRYLRAKVAFGLAQVDLCLSASRAADRWHQARREFREVVRAYRPTIVGLRDDAAEAHAGIGLSDLQLQKDPRGGYVAARREYRAAAETTTIDRRRGFFYGMVGYANVKLGDHPAAAVAYRRAAALTTDEGAKRRYATAAERNRRL